MKRPYHKGRVRERLIEQGRKILSSGSIDNLSLRGLAREVGIAASSVYHHFANRDSLMAALAAEGFEELIELEKAAFAAEKDFKESIKAAARAYLIFADRNPHLYRLMFRWESTQASAFPELVRAGMGFFALNVRWWYDEEYDEARPISDYPAPFLAWSTLHGLAMFVIQRSLVFEGTGQEDLARLVDDIEEYLFPALAAAGLKERGDRK